MITTAWLIWSIIALPSVFALGSMVGSALAWRRVQSSAAQLMAEAWEKEAPKEVWGLAALVASRTDSRLAVVVTGNTSDSKMLLGMASHADLTVSERNRLLMDAIGALEHLAQETTPIKPPLAH